MDDEERRELARAGVHPLGTAGLETPRATVEALRATGAATADGHEVAGRLAEHLLDLLRG